MRAVHSCHGAEIFERACAAIDRMQITEALCWFREAAEQKHDIDQCEAGMWTCHMLLGELGHAWRVSDRISQRGSPDPHRFWDGTPFAGKRVIVRCLHGLGDTLHFIRYAPLLRAATRHLTIEAQPRLKALLVASNLADEVITWGDREPLWEQQIEVVELPRVFRTTLESVPAQIPYLHPGFNGEQLPAYSKECLHVGVLWRSGDFNPDRSVPAEQFAQLFGVSGVRYYSLQPSAQGDNLGAWTAQVPQISGDPSRILQDARTIRKLDLIITVDTMMAHLAGAVGCAVWTLLPFVCDWRWMIERRDSPWYPTMRLFRQERTGDWNSVLSRVRSELERAAHALLNC